VLNINPDITNADRTVRLSPGSIFQLKFNVSIDREQLPLRRITVDWGDGEDQANDSNLAIAPREDPSNPHIYAHAYDCQDVLCKYHPKIQVQDSWGSCNDGSTASATTSCYANQNSVTNPWAGDIKIIVE
jgi:hypothetical protein